MTSTTHRQAGAFFGRRKGHALRPRAGRAVRDAAAAARARSRRARAGRPARAVSGGRRRRPARDRLRRRRAPDRAKPSDIRAPASSASSRSSTAWPRRWPRSRRASSPTSACITATRPTCWPGCRPASLARVDLLYPDPVAEAAALEAALRAGRKRRRDRARSCGPAANSASPATSRTMWPGRWRGCCARRDFTWTAERADDWRQPWPGFSGTRYEAKAKREGRVPCYLIFRRTIE